MTRTGVYPGSFNPPTIAHLAIAEAAMVTHHLERVDLCLSLVALAKEHVDRPLFEHRVEVVRQSIAHLDWLGIVTTEHQLLVDIADGYDVVIMGADKWAQVNDPVFYGDSAKARDDAVRRLPTIAVAPRPPLPVPPEHHLDVPDWAAEVSSTEARAGRSSLMTDAARTFDELTGAWSDPDRYESWLRATD